AAVLMHDPVLEGLEKAEKFDEITQAFENSEKAWEEEKANLLSEKQQMLEDLSRERLARKLRGESQRAREGRFRVSGPYERSDHRGGSQCHRRVQSDRGQRT
ncbi:hypothetical protein PanWU01x14_023330, partial [Parasponia andersonii]